MANAKSLKKVMAVLLCGMILAGCGSAKTSTGSGAKSDNHENVSAEKTDEEYGQQENNEMGQVGCGVDGEHLHSSDFVGADFAPTEYTIKYGFGDPYEANGGQVAVNYSSQITAIALNDKVINWEDICAAKESPENAANFLLQFDGYTSWYKEKYGVPYDMNGILYILQQDDGTGQRAGVKVVYGNYEIELNWTYGIENTVRDKETKKRTISLEYWTPETVEIVIKPKLWPTSVTNIEEIPQRDRFLVALADGTILHMAYVNDNMLQNAIMRIRE